MRIHPTPHQPALSTFLRSPPIHLIHKFISKATAFDPRSGRLPQRAVCIVHLKHVYIFVDKCSLGVDTQQVSLECRVVIRQRGQSSVLICKCRPMNASLGGTYTNFLTHHLGSRPDCVVLAMAIK